MLGISALFGTSYAILQATLYQIAGPSANLTNALMLGIGLSSLIVNAVRMIFLAAVPNLNIEAQMFFYGSALFLLFCTVLSFKFVAEYEADDECKKYKQSHTIK